jgi:hypothetical protein
MAFGIGGPRKASTPSHFLEQDPAPRVLYRPEIKMRLFLRNTLVVIVAMSALGSGIPSAQAQSYNRWGVFRERSLFGNLVDQRRCAIRELAPNQIVFDELLARVSTRFDAVSVYRVLVGRGQCAL